jgi:hypothetical protein
MPAKNFPGSHKPSDSANSIPSGSMAEFRNTSSHDLSIGRIKTLFSKTIEHFLGSDARDRPLQRMTGMSEHDGLTPPVRSRLIYNMPGLQGTDPQGSLTRLGQSLRNPCNPEIYNALLTRFTESSSSLVLISKPKRVTSFSMAWLARSTSPSMRSSPRSRATSSRLVMSL